MQTISMSVVHELLAPPTPKAASKKSKRFDSSDIVPAINPFTILIDSQEQLPFCFDGMFTDADEDNRPLVVGTERCGLGIGKGDYTIKGVTPSGILWHELFAIERKSIDDCHGTILGWGKRRENFERELTWLNGRQQAAIIVEGSLGEILRSAPQHGKKSAEENRKILFRSILSWKVKFPNVHWNFCDDRRLAEVFAFRTMQMFWRVRRNQELEEAKKNENPVNTA